MQVGEEKEVSELLPAWGQDMQAAVTKLTTAAAHSSQQDAQQQGRKMQQQQQQGANHAQAAASSSRQDAGADASTLAPGGSIELRNVYFEAVPLSLVSAVITDQGVMDQAQVGALMQARTKAYEQAFGLNLPDDLLAA